MLYCENWEKIKERYLEFWAMENHDRPLLKITAPKDNRKEAPVSKHATLKERWMDTEYTLKRANWSMQNTLYLGEAYPYFSPDLGPDYFAACYGTGLIFGETTSWAEPWMTDEDVENYQGNAVINLTSVPSNICSITVVYPSNGIPWYLSLK